MLTQPIKIYENASRVVSMPSNTGSLFLAALNPGVPTFSFEIRFQRIFSTQIKIIWRV
jgi:hypothetical protein